MKISEASPDAVYEVALNMRDRDFAEFTAVSFANTRDELAVSLADRFGISPEVHVGYYRNRPVCVGGSFQARPNVISLLFFATEEFGRVALPATRFIKKELFPRLVAAGVHRIEAVSMEGHVETHAWLNTLGLKAETGPLLGYGKNGETFVQFAWSTDVR